MTCPRDTVCPTLTHKLAEKAAAYGLRGEVADTVSGALARAREMASEEDMIFIGGSNFVVAEVLE
jgi:dihydrofolate synthase/folylpolyglutamate synthase